MKVLRGLKAYALVATLLLLSGVAMAQVEWGGMVVRIDQSGVVINMGLNRNIHPGQEFYVYRMDTLVGKLKVTQVDDISSVTAVVMSSGNSSVQIGDVISSTLRTTPPPAAVATPPAVVPTSALPPASSDPIKDFGDLIKKNTQALIFKVGGPTKKSPTLPVAGIVNLLSTVPLLFSGANIPAGELVNPMLVGSMAVDYYQESSYMKSMNNPNSGPGGDPRTLMEIVYWDEAMVNSYANYYCYKEAYLDDSRRAEVRRTIYAGKGLDKNVVFQIRLTNKSYSSVQLAPFNWHFYLIDANGKRIKATRYDEALDKSINPNQSTQGYAYFSRFDANGQPVLGPGPIKVQIEDVMGQKGAAQW